MMSRHAILSLSALFLAAAIPTVDVRADNCGLGARAASHGRQFHTAWKASGKGYYYSKYFFKVSPSDCHYQVHLCIYTPRHPGCFFYYNQQKGKLWGVYFSGQPTGQSFFKHESDNLPTFAELASSQDAAHAMPSIPGAADQVAMMTPPGTPR